MSIISASCNKSKYKVDIPSYLEIKYIQVSTDTVTEGSNADGISDAWVFVDDISVGTFELPAMIPVVEEGVHRISIFAGIKISGISTVRGVYPFFRVHEINIDLTPGETTVLNPEVSYYSGLNFAWIEDFNLGQSMIKSGLSDTMLILENVEGNSKLGPNSAVIYIDQSNPYFEARTKDGFFTPPQGFTVYLELSYKTENLFSVGVFKNTLAGLEKVTPFLAIYPNSEWNTIYIEFTDYMKIHTDALSFEIYFSALLESGLSSATIYIDNAKLIHY